MLNNSLILVGMRVKKVNYEGGGYFWVDLFCFTTIQDFLFFMFADSV